MDEDFIFNIHLEFDPDDHDSDDDEAFDSEMSVDDELEHALYLEYLEEREMRNMDWFFEIIHEVLPQADSGIEDDNEDRN